MPPIRLFTPSVADEDNTNAQNLTVKEIVARLSPEQFHVTMIAMGKPDARIAARRNTKLLPYYKRGNTARMLLLTAGRPPDVYFYPRQGPLDMAFLWFRRHFLKRCAVVTHTTMVMNEATVTPAWETVVRESDRLLGNSRYVTETVTEYFHRPAETMHNGVDSRWFYVSGGSQGASGRVRALYAGSFQERKRAAFLVRLAKRWPEVEFRLAGKGEEEEPCRRLAAELGCGNVSFLGHLNPAALGEEMRAADLFLFPSVLEGHPQVLGQAAACGLPAVAMNLYRPDYVVDGETGFLAKSEEDFAEKVEVLVASRELRGRMSAAAVRHAEQFSWDRIAGLWAEVLESAVAGRRG
jgi:glycosyltransferase involved in cell wall biosynthesis